MDQLETKSGTLKSTHSTVASPLASTLTHHGHRGRRKSLRRITTTAAKGVNPLRKIQLSIFNNRYIPIDPNPNNAYRLVPKRPMDYNAFAKHMELIRKYEVLLKIEFQVRIFFSETIFRKDSDFFWFKGGFEKRTVHQTRHETRQQAKQWAEEYISEEKCSM